MSRYLGRKLVAGAAICLATMVALAGGTAANAATGTALPTQTMTVHLTGPAASGAHPDASTGGQVSLCYITMSGGAVENNYVSVSVGSYCQIPSYIVSGNIIFANNTHPYAASATIGSTGNGRWFTVKAVKGGTIGYRSAEWCVTIGTSNGAVGSGCLALYGM
jgi:hypothetical protein